MHQYCEKWTYVFRKIHKNEYLFLAKKSPLKMCKGFEARAAQPGQINAEYPPAQVLFQFKMAALYMWCVLFK